ncbi:MAG: hypothetical protein E7216_09695 [Clostridium thermopalmarium]|uniref:hypothetical protein n=1 Tax=Clostridium thermopalmarium TaxID=29373 RepID=UPI0023572B83|nr:hypothetical protein [Clostridium thermopalmarium]MBE6044490.1 hypothetical protein [Clostridium thermopalmarium]
MNYDDTCKIDIRTDSDNNVWEADCYNTDENYRWDDGFSWNEKENISSAVEDETSNNDFDWNKDEFWREDFIERNLLPEGVHSNQGVEGVEIIGETQDFQNLQNIEDNSVKDNIENSANVENEEKYTKDSIEYLNEVCIKPLEHILEQLSKLGAKDIEIGTEKQGTILEARILSMENFLVEVQTPYNYSIIPLHKIVGIYSRDLPKVDLLSSLEEEKTDRVQHCEKALREYFINKIGKNFKVNTSALDELFRTIKGTVTRVGEGIVVLNDTVAILLNKIVSVEKNKKDIDAIE